MKTTILLLFLILSPFAFAQQNTESQCNIDNYKAFIKELGVHGCDLREAILQGVDLRRANLQSADLREANLINADLRGAKLQGANLRKARLRGAKVTVEQTEYLRAQELLGGFVVVE